MNIVFASHTIGGKKYCFLVSDAMTPHITKGTILYVDTKKGPALAYATAGVIQGNGAEDIARESGAYFPLREVFSFVPFTFREMIIKDAVYVLKCRIQNVLNEDELPF